MSIKNNICTTYNTSIKYDSLFNFKFGTFRFLDY